MGERKLGVAKAKKKVIASASQEAAGAVREEADKAMRVNTPGGVFSVRWDERGSATALGQLAFFAEYLEVTGVFERWLKACPLNYTSPNAPELVDVLGTWMLSILDGHCRYAHVGVLRGDGVTPDILGMKRIIGDDSLRRALSAIAPAPDDRHTPAQRAAQQAQLARAVQWMQEQLKHSIAQATATPWILDCDTTIKVLYGKQGGAVVSYNPHKPGRPSHAIHTYWIGNLRLVLDAQLEPARLVRRGARLGGLRGRSGAHRLEPASARHCDAPRTQERPDRGGQAHRSSQGQRTSAGRAALHRRKRAGQELGVRGAGVQRALRAGQHWPVVP